MMVEPESFCWLSGRMVEHRDGATWAEEFRHYPKLQFMVSDAGTGLLKGVRLVQKERPGLRHGLDVFHTIYEGNKVLRQEYGQAARALEKAEHGQAELDRLGRQGQSRAGTATHVQNGWRDAEQQLDRAAAAEQAWKECRAALELFRPDGTVNDRRQAEATVAGILPRLSGTHWGKVRRLLQRPETFAFLDRMHEQLRALDIPDEELAVLIRLEGLRRYPHLLQGATPQAAALRGVVVVRAAQLAKADANWPAKAEQLGQVLRQTLRASSLVEGINSVARMQQARHRKMTQGLLDLKRLYWNLRPFRTGRRRRQTPYEKLGLQVPSVSWWELLKMTPEQLHEQLSSQAEKSAQLDTEQHAYQLST
jgi:hypothetical protein